MVSVNFNVDLCGLWFWLTRSDFHRAQWKSGCLYVELQLLSVHLISHVNCVRLPARGSVMSALHCSVQSPELCRLSALCVVGLCSIISLQCWCSFETLTAEMNARPAGGVALARQTSWALVFSSLSFHRFPCEKCHVLEMKNANHL